MQRKIKAGEPVSIGVLCSGNATRSPLAQAVLQKAFHDAGHHNVSVFSFGTSLSPEEHNKGVSPRTLAHTREMGYDLSTHKRRYIGNDYVQNAVKKADLVIGVTPAHLYMAIEYAADESPEVYRNLRHKGWTLAGLAAKKEWTLPFRMLSGGVARGLSFPDPYFIPKTPEAAAEYRRNLEAVERAAKLAARRLIKG
ncbi:MAG: hypothetical protein AB1626_02615 [Candidatus Micrarchaeota archaeon]